MEWATSTRVRAIAAAAGVAFYAAAASHAQAQAVQPAGDGKPPGSQVKQDTASGGTLPAISVSADAERDASVGLVARRSTTGTKTDTPIVEIPQTINVVTAQQIEATGATDINQAFRYIPGFSTYGSDNRSDWYAALRGFTPTVFVDGLQVPNTLNLSSWRVDPYMIDSITVLRGPTSVLYGQGDPGAIVDVQSKLANGERIREAGVQVGNYARKQLMFDIGDKIDKDGTLSYRIVGVGRDGNSQSGPLADQRVSFAPSVKWQPNADTSLTLSATYLQDWSGTSTNFLPAQGTVLPNPNGTISNDLYTADANFDHYRKKQWSLGYQFEHRLNPVWTFRQNVRWMHLSLDDASVYGGGLDDADPTMATMTRYAGLFQFNYSRFDVDNQAQAKFATGPLAHTVLFGFDYNRQTTTDSEWLAKAPSLNMFRPVYAPITTGIFSGPTAYPRTDTKTTLNAFGVYVQDQIKWQRWVLTLGGRHDWTNTTQDDIANSASFKQNDHAFSGRVGLTYLGDYGLAPYLSYSTSFNPQIGLKLAGGGLATPTKGRQIEAGLRWQPPGKNLMLNAAVYQINQTNVAMSNPNDSTSSTFVQVGEVRSRGVELSAVGNLSRELSVIAAYVYQDVKNVKANDNTLNRWPVDVPRPRQIASLWADWTWRNGPLTGFGVGAGVRYMSAAAGAADNSLTVPSYTLFDAALHYELRNWRFAINATNLFNRRYVSGCQSEAVCMYGNERTVIATAKYNW
ncbi:TonB-dependent siderophore receptor [Burkholderia oklahomensis]|uniref:TonB-dependent siderophore receptor n=1 Tax=Burkholderia oklahomensis TaxID=342113 RepID=UPI00016A8D49|nr:TonB-dependent siderophore receptor [Burkholderia oklahomensis]AJX32377.1 TonB-dependent siderophore receptor family protein [Burkholderia oklahomensis C6786]AOI46021.1 TonB-dependent receptor [Burkholderia oklahomensis C6786]KUY54750.1 TonB-dependent receptor [Burkholderia oklahomensis C6786]MBI0361425.1 TonB-dependent siderophore receptor [Burkholderia oklahomensis]SUW55383.1 Ferric hydroxamate uptake [Burkholderia oklahomensis]